MSVFNIQYLHKNSDKLGAISSTICAIHCMATPFLFIAKSCSVTCCSETPSWWKAIDVLFLVISFIAIYFSAKNSSNTYIKFGLYVSWLILALIIANDYADLITLPHWVIYLPAFSLVILHIYNIKYCRCKAGCCNA